MFPGRPLKNLFLAQLNLSSSTLIHRIDRFEKKKSSLVVFVHDIEIDGTKSKNTHVQTEIYSIFFENADSVNITKCKSHNLNFSNHFYMIRTFIK